MANEDSTKFKFEVDAKAKRDALEESIDVDGKLHIAPDVRNIITEMTPQRRENEHNETDVK